MTFNQTTRQSMLSYAAGTSTWASLHTSDPGETGASEASGGGYARVAITWGSPSGDSMVSGSLDFTAPAGTYTHIGYWTGNSGGTFKGKSELTPPIVLAATGAAHVSSITESLGECP
ncbi:MAG TPA: hypothetical protein ENI86_09310 [Acidimicrobiales bacterium]|nr:hypothetical protein [Acidimicrobiales bacterium]